MQAERIVDWELPEVTKLRSQRDELLIALRDLQLEIHRAMKFNVRKHFSLMVADAGASKAIRKAEMQTPQQVKLNEGGSDNQLIVRHLDGTDHCVIDPPKIVQAAPPLRKE